MSLYANPGFDWPPAIDFKVIGTDEPRTGTIEVLGDYYFLSASPEFSFSSFEPLERVLKTQIDGRPSLLLGQVFAVEGVAGLLIDEARIGTDDLKTAFVSVEAEYELLPSLRT
ncbi:hypothetical protein GCM10022198_22260 [Klugiella xanthotipulae]|uniref:Uncharacterized protein n=1 Tax=Klugiella xanthotipulae TaxID=244735 RepID=A0A543I5U9_9MICO|nr:hypothetical protein [Klugiella xanthotipulae]TQM65982.1 hypothetical protein FB466_0802 [Klugiella xanthotipulae]